MTILDDLKEYKILEKSKWLWKPEKHHDEYRNMLMKWIENKIPIHSEGAIERKSTGKRDDVIDFMTFLKQRMMKKSLNKLVHSGKSAGRAS